jgi:transcription-repair coupling factor (superfamily II helicase)
VDASQIIQLVQRNRHIRLAGNDKLRIDKALPEPRERAHFVRDVLRSLGATREPQVS